MGELFLGAVNSQKITAQYFNARQWLLKFKMRPETEIFQGSAEAGDQTYKDNKTRFELSVKLSICSQGSSLFKRARQML